MAIEAPTDETFASDTVVGVERNIVDYLKETVPALVENLTITDISLDDSFAIAIDNQGTTAAHDFVRYTISMGMDGPGLLNISIGKYHYLDPIGYVNSEVTSKNIELTSVSSRTVEQFTSYDDFLSKIQEDDIFTCWCQADDGGDKTANMSFFGMVTSHASNTNITMQGNGTLYRYTEIFPFGNVTIENTGINMSTYTDIDLTSRETIDASEISIFNGWIIR